MFDRCHSSALFRTLLAGAMLGLASCSSEPHATATPKNAAATHAEISNDVTASAQVVALDKAVRLVTLRCEDGQLVDVHAGDEVRNYDQIAIGDQLRVHYRQALGATLLPPGSDPAVVAGGVGAARAKAGAKPGAMVGAGLSVRVKIVSVDTAHDLVVFSLPSGELVAHRIATPEGRTFIKGVNVGDLVQLDYTEALALSIDTVKPAG